MMRSLARTLGPYGITVNAVAAGVIVTEMLGKTHNSSAKQDELINATPLRVFGKPEDLGFSLKEMASGPYSQGGFMNRSYRLGVCLKGGGQEKGRV